MSNVIFSCDFETFPFAPKPWAKQVGRITQSSAWAREGKYSAMIEVKKGDPMIAKGARSELNNDEYPIPKTPYIQFYAGSNYVPPIPPWQVETNPLMTVITAQWHSDSGQPPIAFGISNTWWYVQAAFINNNKITNLAPVVPGEAVDWAWQINWALDKTGWIEIFMNQKSVGKWSGQTYPNGQSAGPFFKMGLYKWPWNTDDGPPQKTNTTDLIIYLDSVKVGNSQATLADVSPAGAVTPVPPIPAPNRIAAVNDAVTITYNDGTPPLVVNNVKSYTPLVNGSFTIVDNNNVTTVYN